MCRSNTLVWVRYGAGDTGISPIVWGEGGYPLLPPPLRYIYPYLGPFRTVPTAIVYLFMLVVGATAASTRQDLPAFAAHVASGRLKKPSSPTKPNRWSGGQPLNKAYASDTRRHGFLGTSGAQDHLPDHLHLQTTSEVVRDSVILCHRKKLCPDSRRVFLWVFSFTEAHYD